MNEKRIFWLLLGSIVSGLFATQTAIGQFTLLNVGHTLTGGSANSVVVLGNTAYLANGYDGFRIYDVSDRANPINVGFATNHPTAMGIAVSGEYAYVASNVGGLWIYDISDRTNPIGVGHIITWGMKYFTLRHSEHVLHESSV